MAYIEIENLEKTYKIRNTREKIRALSSLTLSIERGDIVGLVGLNGAGKTTFMKLLTGIIEPTDGTIKVEQFLPYQKKREFLRKIGFVMGQKTQLWWDLGAIDSFDIEREIYKIPKARYRQLVAELAEMLHIQEKIYQPVRQLSLGERMKCEIMLCLLHQPELLILDEPTLGLDVLSQQALREFLLSYKQNAKNTIFISSHNLRDIEDICDKILILNKGNLVFFGKKEVLQENFKQYSVVRAFTEEKLVLEDVLFMKRTQMLSEMIVRESEKKNLLSYMAAHTAIKHFELLPLDLEAVIYLIYRGEGQP